MLCIVQIPEEHSQNCPGTSQAQDQPRREGRQVGPELSATGTFTRSQAPKPLAAGLSSALASSSSSEKAGALPLLCIGALMALGGFAILPGIPHAHSGSAPDCRPLGLQTLPTPHLKRIRNHQRKINST